MEALLIDPFTKTCNVVEFDGDVKTLYKLIDCTHFERAQVSDTHHLYVDGEGLLNNPTHFFRHPYFPSWLAGKGLLLGEAMERTNYGTEEEPEWVDEPTWGAASNDEMLTAMKIKFGSNEALRKE